MSSLARRLLFTLMVSDVPISSQFGWQLIFFCNDSRVPSHVVFGEKGPYHCSCCFMIVMTHFINKSLWPVDWTHFESSKADKGVDGLKLCVERRRHRPGRKRTSFHFRYLTCGLILRGRNCRMVSAMSRSSNWILCELSSPPNSNRNSSIEHDGYLSCNS